MYLMLLGAVIMALLTVGFLFLRSWKETRDRFFLFFAASFFIEGATRLMLGLLEYSSEQEPLFYLLRLLGFVLILYAIADKNWARR